jgi:hypothetical protein
MLYYNKIDPNKKVVPKTESVPKAPLVSEAVEESAPTARRFSGEGSLGYEQQTLTGNVSGGFNSKKFTAGLSANFLANKIGARIQSYGATAEYRPNSNISLRGAADDGKFTSTGINYHTTNDKFSADAELTKDNYRIRAAYAPSEKLALEAGMSKGNRSVGLMYNPSQKVAVRAGLSNNEATAAVQYTPNEKFTAGISADKNGPKANARFSFKTGGLIY